MRTLLLLVCASALVFNALAQSEAGKRHYDGLCSGCHGGDGNGGELGPPIGPRLPLRDDAQLAALVRDGLPGAGMPAFKLSDTEVKELVTHLRSMRPRRFRAPRTAKVSTTTGATLEGVVLNESLDDMQIRTADQRIHLLRKSGDKWRPVTSTVDWPSYHGAYSANRYSRLAQINTSNISRLAAQWMFTLPNTSRLQATPVVIGGIMYVTSANECYALDAGTGRQLWHYRRDRTKGLHGNAAGGINRGVAVLDDRLFMVTDHAHLLALNRLTGALLWETVMADWKQNYDATGAPLVVGNLVIAGHSGGDEGVRGVLAAYDPQTGKEVWRTWMVPLRGEPGGETWSAGHEHGGATTWLTGSYDPELDTLYWPTGNPGPDMNGDNRKGDNLYSDSIVALDPKTGKMKWHFQYTPHDVWDWDAQQPPVLIDAAWQGRQRKLLLHANRNGFLYVLDRTNGELLLAKPFVKKLTWATGIGKDGRPILVPGKEPTKEGTHVCPSIEGATNWFSTSFHPGTGLYYVQTLEKCNIFTKLEQEWQAGRSYMGGSTSRVPDETPQKILRALDIKTGNVAWEVPQTGAAESWGGVLSTAGGIVLFGEDSGALMAVDARNGKSLWKFQTSQLWKASPMTYEFDGKQYIAVAAGSNVIAFALGQ